MKSIKILLLSLAFVTFGSVMTSCADGSTTTHSEKNTKEFTSAYVCPMHCESSGSTEAGKCPVCGMGYVKLDEHISNGHKH